MVLKSFFQIINQQIISLTRSIKTLWVPNFKLFLFSKEKNFIQVKFIDKNIYQLQKNGNVKKPSPMKYGKRTTTKYLQYNENKKILHKKPIIKKNYTH
jgi:hypothetical protein